MSVANIFFARGLASIIGVDELTENERTYLRFGERFERELVGQRGDEARTIAQTLDRAWSVLRELPRADLTRVRDAVLEKYFTP